MKEPAKTYVSKAEAAAMLGVCERTIDNRLKRGELPAVTDSFGKVRIPRAAVERLGKSTALAVRRLVPLEAIPRPVPLEAIPQEPMGEVLLDALIERKLAKMATSAANSILEPFFQSKAVSDEIRRGQTLAERAKWKLYYAKWGCLICGTQDTPHTACGMCANCSSRTQDRLKVVIGQAEDVVRRRAALVFHDLTEEAQAALQPPETESEE